MRYSGECIKTKPKCFTKKCNNKYRPVCGAKDITYKNNCLMECPYGDTLKYKGTCKID